MLAIDTEDTGVDFFHGARPFLVTCCDKEMNQTYWEWDVDPFTRKVEIPNEDASAIRQLINSHDELILQNAKFDATALLKAKILNWSPLWSRTHDTLISGHLLASNQPHDLTSMVKQYLGDEVNIEPFEVKLQEAVTEAKKAVRKMKPKLTMDLHTGLWTSNGEWHLAKPGLEEMPSAKEKTWKFDLWLPRAVARYLGYSQPDDDCEHTWEDWHCSECKGHHWWSICADYANADSSTTIALWQVMVEELKARNLWEIYLEKVKSVEALWEMEHRGVSLLMDNLIEVRDEYETEIEASKNRCKQIAQKRKFKSLRPFTLPKTGNNIVLTEFCFSAAPTGLGLPVIKKTEKGNPSLDKEAIEQYKLTLEADSLEFIKHLGSYRKREKSQEFFEAYLKYQIDGLLHASLNPTATATTRLSCKAPNLQQVSKQESKCDDCDGEGCDLCGFTGEDLHSVRKIFGPGPGREWWTADAENIELRIPAYASGQKQLIDLFERAHEPPFFGRQHILNFSIVYPDLWQQAVSKAGLEKAGDYVKEEWKSTWYQWDKNGGFAIQYQCGRETADRSFHKKGAFDLLKTTFADLEALNQQCLKMANTYGYIETLPDKEINPKQGYPLLCARTEYGTIKPTTPLNYFSQGTAGWWMIKAMNRCGAQLREWRKDGFDGWMVLTVHDELIFDFPKGRGVEPWKTNLPKVRCLKALMEKGGEDIEVPTPVSVSYHPKNWKDGIKVPLWSKNTFSLTGVA